MRTETYGEAIMQSFILGKVKLDVVQEFFLYFVLKLVQSGCTQLMPVSDIALQANEVVKANNLSDVVVVLHG